MNYLSEYKNPCWESKLPRPQPYSENPYRNDVEAKNPMNRLRDMMSKKIEHGDTYRLRCFPLVYLVGVTKSGTTDIFDSMVKHPEIVMPVMKEPMWWDRHTIGWCSFNLVALTIYVISQMGNSCSLHFRKLCGTMGATTLFRSV